MKFVLSVLLTTALLAACGDGDDSKKIYTPIPDVTIPDIGDASFDLCGLCQAIGACSPKSDAGPSDRMFCQSIGACTHTGTCAADGGHK